MNFHQIKASDEEAFVTGRMGDKLDVPLMLAVLNAIKDSGIKYMTEIEQYVGEWVLKEDTIIPENEYKSIDVSDEMDQLSEFDSYLIDDIPPMELHLGFNLNSKLSIPLDKLVESCKQAGLNNGGWFIFGESSYRSNEFYRVTDIQQCKRLLFEQAFKLKNILRDDFGVLDVDILLSLEHVHAIWQF